MVFPGRLSTGCHVCRRRKVKCDGDKPECRRCAQHGVQCTGYPDKFGFREYKPSRERAAASSAPPQRSAVTGSSLRIHRTRRLICGIPPSDCSQAVSTEPRLEPSRALSVCTDWQSLCSFMHQVVLKVHRSPCEGHLAFLPDFFREKGDDPCLKHALLSVSYLMLSNISGARQLHIKARKNYGLSLEHLNKALGSHGDAVRDEVLAACLLLSIFFNFVNECGSPDPHMSGISHLLLMRGHEQAKSKYSRHLVGWTIVQIIQAIGTNNFQFVRIPAFIQAMLNPDCVLRAGILNSILSQFCQSTSDILNSFDSSSSGDSRRQKLLEDQINCASILIEEIEIWNASIPPHWKKQYQFESTDVAAVSAASPPDPWTITFLAITHSAQIVFYLHVLSCCKEIQRHDPEFSIRNSPGGLGKFCETIAGQIFFLLKVICYTVSSTIGFLDENHSFQPLPTAKFANSNTLLWPMWAVVTCPSASKDQINLCRQALHYIGQVLGHKLAFSLSNKDSGRQPWLPD